ncbi:MAG: hypothetical protein ABR860_08100 [Terracidiphilus sp.]|jgi:hypothetical protein
MIEMPTYAPQLALPQPGLSLAPVRETHSTIFKAISVNADAHRISRALTVPEYLEAWISIPCAAPGSYTLVSSQDNGYRLDYYSAHDSAQRSALTIKGSFLFCHLRKIRLFWRKTSNALCADSVVDFRLRGNFGSSVVELRHTALASADEHAWHEALWRGSLEKLALLFGS